MENVGGIHSLLDWEIIEHPNWGEWNFYPENGEDLEYDNQVSIYVEIIAPSQKDQIYSGVVKISNKENPNDYCEIDVYLETPKNVKIKNNFFRLFLKMEHNFFNYLNFLLFSQ